MNKLKQIDVKGQLWLMIAWLTLAVFPVTRGVAFLGYFIIGGWQVTSTAIHHQNRDNLILFRQRKFYNGCLLAVMATGLLCFIFPVITFFYLFGLLLVSPIMAIWYLLISFHEWEIWKAKAWVHLK